MEKDSGPGTSLRREGGEQPSWARKLQWDCRKRFPRDTSQTCFRTDTLDVSTSTFFLCTNAHPPCPCWYQRSELGGGGGGAFSVNEL